MDRLLLLLSTFAFIGAMVLAMVSLRRGTWRDARWNWVAMAVGCALQTGFLSLRGEMHGRCPLTNLFEVLIFIGWAIVLLYFLMGASYRLSLLGMFTAPMIALLQIVSMSLSLDQAEPSAHLPPNAWRELHSAVSLFAYAAFAMACVTGVMYLVQERMLKKHEIHSLFFQLPPIHELAKAIRRMVILGVALLSVGLLCSWPLNTPVTDQKMISAWIVWAMYVGMSVMMWRHSLSARRTAWVAVLGFAVPVISLWWVTKA